MRGRPLHDQDAVERSAMEFRAKYAPNHIGRLDIEQIVEVSLGIEIIPVPGLCRRRKAKGWASNSKMTIVVDRDIFRNQLDEYRQHLAHETAHVYRHRRFFPTAPFSTVAECREFHARATETETLVSEHEANLWAGYVLVPRQQLDVVFRRVVGNLQQLYDELCEHKGAPAGTDDSELRQIIGNRVVRVVADHFGVTESWAERRIRDDGLWRRMNQVLAAARELAGAGRAG